MRRPRSLAAWIVVFSAACGAAQPPPPVVAIEAPKASGPTGDEPLYCGETSDRNGVPECLAPIDGETQRHRARSWIFRRQGGRVVRVEEVNGLGNLIDDADGAAAWDLLYEGGRVSQESELSSTGRLVDTRRWSPDSTRVEIVDERGAPRALRGTRITTEQIERDADGRLLVRRYLDAQGKPTTNRSGFYEVRTRRDAHGAVVEVTGLDAEHKPMLGKEGFARIQWVRDAQLVRTEELRFDAGGAPVLSRPGWHRVAWTLDRFGNITETRYFGVDGGAAADAQSGARMKFGVDKHGNIIDVERYGLDGALAAGPEHWARRHLDYDDKGRLAEIENFDAKGAHEATSPRLRYRRDDKGRIVEHDLLDRAGKLREDRASIERLRYDARDEVMEVRLFDPREKPARGFEGEYGWRLERDDLGRVTRKTYLGEEGQPAPTTRGEATVVTTYAADGTATEQHLDADGKAVLVYGAKHLLVQFKGAMRAPATVTRTRAQALARTEEARKKILAGMTFEAAVAAYSDEPGAGARGGDLGKFRRGAMVKSFQDAVEALELNRVSKPVESPFGFHLIIRTQ